MRLSLQFPLHTKSENEVRGFGNPFARASYTRKQRADVRLFLDSQLPKPRVRLSTGSNWFRVTLVRISAGELDSGSVVGALKNVRDEVAAWIGIGDGPRDPASWKEVQQLGPRGYHAVRVEIEDDDPDPREVRKILGPMPAKLGPIIGDCAHCGRPTLPEPITSAAKRAARKRFVSEQKALVFRRAFYADPAEQPNGSDDLVLKPIAIIADPPAPTLRLRRTIDGHPYTAATLVRRLEHHPDLGEIWVYAEDETPAGTAQAIRHRRATP